MKNQTWCKLDQRMLLSSDTAYTAQGCFMDQRPRFTFETKAYDRKLSGSLERDSRVPRTSSLSV